MGKHVNLIEVVKNELIDSKDNLLMYMEDYIASTEDGEIPSISFADIHAMSSEVDTLGDLLFDLISTDFSNWNIVIDASFRDIKDNNAIVNAIDIFRREVTTNE